MSVLNDKEPSSSDLKDLYFKRDIEIDSLGDGETLVINQRYYGDVGVVVWDCALLVVKFFDHQNAKKPGIFRGKTAIELGSGTGVCGLSLALFGCDSILTDLPEIVDLAEKNVAENRELFARCNSGHANVISWRWGDFKNGDEYIFDKDLKTIDYIIVSDCVYYEQGLEGLCKSLSWFCGNCGPSMRIFLAYEDREDKVAVIEKFFNYLETFGNMEWSEIDAEDYHPDFRSPDLHIFIIQRKL